MRFHFGRKFNLANNLKIPQSETYYLCYFIAVILTEIKKFHYGG